MEDKAVEMDISNESRDEVARVAMRSEVKNKALSITKKKFGHIFGIGPASEVHQIAEDALNKVTLDLLKNCSDSAKSPDLEKQLKGPAIFNHPIARYLIKGVSNYCNTRLSRWSGENGKGQMGSRARHYINSDQADDADFWDQHLRHDGGLDSVDQERIDEMLSQRGMSEEDIALIKRNLAGWSFVDLAEEFGGTADKYRRRIHRALEAAGIDPKLLK